MPPFLDEEVEADKVNYVILGNEGKGGRHVLSVTCGSEGCPRTIRGNQCTWTCCLLLIEGPRVSDGALKV